MEIKIDKLMMEDLLEEIEISDKFNWVSEPISIGSTDLFLEIGSNGSEVTFKVTHTNLKGLELDLISVTQDL